MKQSVPTLTVGITGHRWNKIPQSEAARITEQLSSVFAAINSAVQQSPSAARHSQPITLRLVSGLAEGADQLAILSRPDGWILDAILPFPRERYRDDFAPAQATGGIDRRPEFEAALAQARSIVELPDREDAERGYELAGDLLVHESDLLVAVWDGNQAAGPGGTEAVVTRAISLGIPVVWICSRNDQEPTLLSAPAAEYRHAALADAEAIRRIVETIVETQAAASPFRPAGTRTP